MSSHAHRHLEGRGISREHVNPTLSNQVPEQGLSCRMRVMPITVTLWPLLLQFIFHISVRLIFIILTFLLSLLSLKKSSVTACSKVQTHYTILKALYDLVLLSFSWLSHTKAYFPIKLCFLRPSKKKSRAKVTRAQVSGHSVQASCHCFILFSNRCLLVETMIKMNIAVLL